MKSSTPSVTVLIALSLETSCAWSSLARLSCRSGQECTKSPDTSNGATHRYFSGRGGRAKKQDKTRGRGQDTNPVRARWAILYKSTYAAGFTQSQQEGSLKGTLRVATSIGRSGGRSPHECKTLDASHAPRFATHVRGVLTPYAVLGGRGGCNGSDCPLHPMP